jgi:hypothetical protein
MRSGFQESQGAVAGQLGPYGCPVIPKPRNLQALVLPYLQTNSPTLGMLIVVVTEVTVFHIINHILTDFFIS